MRQWDGVARGRQRTRMADKVGVVRNAPESYGYPDSASIGSKGLVRVPGHYPGVRHIIRVQEGRGAPAGRSMPGRATIT
nr:hypothetical protein Ade03nite_71200 [Actinoplanes derwentensis]